MTMGGDSKVGTRRSSVGGNHDPVSVKARSAQASSGSTDPSMSIGSNGEAVLSNRVWTLHRFIRGIKKGKVPLNLILILFISLLTAGVAGLAWGLTYTAATTAATTLATSLQTQMLSRITSTVHLYLRAAEQSTVVGAHFWRNGFYKFDTQDDKDAYKLAALSSLQPNTNFYSSQFFTSKNGEMWGAFANVSTGTITYGEWRNGSSWAIDENGEELGVIDPETANSLSEMWMTVVDLNNATDAHWTPAYVWNNQGWKTFSRVVQDSTSTIIGVQGCDMMLTFLSMLLVNLAEATPYRNYLYAFELTHDDGEAILASSEPDLDYLHYDDVNKEYDRGLTLAELTATSEPVAAFYNLIHRATAEGTMAAYLIGKRGQSVLVKVNHGEEKGEYFVQAAQVLRDNTHWAIVQFTDKEDIMGELEKSNRKTIGIVVAVAVAGCISAIVFSFFLSKALYRITRDLTLLSNFKFQDVMQRDMDKESGVSRPQYSRISELWQIQRAFHKMVVTFASAVSQNRRFSHDRKPSIVPPPRVATTREQNMAETASVVESVV